MAAIVSAFVALWLACCLIQLHYWLVTVWPLARVSLKHRQVSEAVSVVICTDGGAENLKSLLEAVIHQDYPAFEVVLVDDGPNSAVKQLVAGMQSTIIRYVPFDNRAKRSGGKKEPLLAGIRAAGNSWLLFTDDDCEVPPGWIEAMMSYTNRNSRLVLGYSPVQTAPGPIAWLNSFDSLLIGINYLSSAIRGRAYMGVGRNMLYHKEVFALTDQLEEHFDLASGDDDLMVQAARDHTHCAIALSSKSFVPTKPKRTFFAFLRQKLRHVSTAPRYHRRDVVRLVTLNVSYMAFWLFGVWILGFVPGLPKLLMIVAIAAQWYVFIQVAERLKTNQFALLFPIISPLHSIFLLLLGALQLIAPFSGDQWS